MIGFGLLSLCGFGILYSGCIVPTALPANEQEDSEKEEVAEENQEENLSEEIIETTEEPTEENL